MALPTLTARDISRIARNPKCQRQLDIFNSGNKPDDVAQNLLGKVSKQSVFQKQAGVQFEKQVIGSSAYQLIDLFIEQELLPKRELLRSIGIFNPEAEFGKVSNAKDKVAQLEKLASITAKKIEERLSGKDTEILLIEPILEIQYANFRGFIRPDFMIAINDSDYYQVGEIKSIQYLGEDTDSGDLKNVYSQAAVESLALEQTYRRLKSFPEKKDAIEEFIEHPMAAIVVRERRMHPRLFYKDISADKNFILDAEEQTLNTARSIKNTGTLELEQISIESISQTTCYVCDHCESDCGLASHCRPESISSGNIRAFGDDIASKLKDRNLNDLMNTIEGRYTPTDEREREEKQVLIDEIRMTELCGGLQTFSQFKKAKENKNEE